MEIIFFYPTSDANLALEVRVCAPWQTISITLGNDQNSSNKSANNASHDNTSNNNNSE